MRQILFFDSMLTPKVITLVYWLLLFGALITGIGTWFTGFGGFTFGRFITGILIIVGGAIAAPFAGWFSKIIPVRWLMIMVAVIIAILAFSNLAQILYGALA